MDVHRDFGEIEDGLADRIVDAVLPGFARPVG